MADAEAEGFIIRGLGVLYVEASFEVGELHTNGCIPTLTVSTPVH
jgi:hypothetical protein